MRWKFSYTICVNLKDNKVICIDNSYVSLYVLFINKNKFKLFIITTGRDSRDRKMCTVIKKETEKNTGKMFKLDYYSQIVKDVERTIFREKRYENVEARLFFFSLKTPTYNYHS